ncbi:MAG: NAD(P)-dependent glycerol-3-phosphate dehydrogenase [Acholeplasmatales bacterium]|jgi:glycerol-3-phosphate dehydrogenase (NAD(P)+)|nr:NAD(P)-dependent glycerol-3-phosphate dehydrogenase [Acholeplasmatales bacterium]
MKISIYGGGAWGSTLAQVLAQNGNEVLIFDKNVNYIESINKGIHPVFNVNLDLKIKGTLDLAEGVNFSNIYLLVLPVLYLRGVLKDINKVLRKKVCFINASKGIEVLTLKTPSIIVKEEIAPSKLNGFVSLTGPSHAEEVIRRRVTLLTAASINCSLAKQVQDLFSNSYLRIYTSLDTIGAELAGVTKNAIAVSSGIVHGMGMGENARAALITRGLIEIIKVVETFGGKKETVYGLAGLGDLIVTASSTLSRNFKAGVRIGQGVPLETIYSEEKETIEGIRTIQALAELSKKNNIELPIINSTYEIIFNNLSAPDALEKLLSRDLKEEDY